MPKNLKITNAYTNNLKHIDLELPHNSVNLIIGKSGSGKTSLAFNTIHSESQAKYIQTFSAYTRQFFNTTKNGKVEKIENIRPSIAIKQKTKIKNSRSTVGTLCHLDDYLKIFFANFSNAYCPICGKKLEFFSSSALSKKLILESNSSINKENDNVISYFLLIAPIKINKQNKEKTLDNLKALGYTRFFNENTLSLFNNNEEIKNENSCSLLLVIDKLLNFSQEKESRLIDDISQSYKLANGVCDIFYFTNSTLTKKSSYSQEPTCSCIDFKIPKPTPRIFSFNNPIGACPKCNGFGKTLDIDLDLVIPNKNLSIKDGAIVIFETNGTKNLKEMLLNFCKKKKIPIDIPFSKLSKEQKDLIYYEDKRDFCGVMAFFNYLKAKTYKLQVRVLLSRYQRETTCPECNGKKLNHTSLLYKINNLDFAEIQDFECSKLKTFINNFLKSEKNLTFEQKEIIKQINERLEIIENLGLSYLTPNRQAKTLSGGETQRVNLVTAIGSPLSNTHFILDEPSVGLHKKDTENLIKTIYKLKSKNNTVTVLEHDPKIISSCEHLTELGKEAGDKGGEIVFNGVPQKWNCLEFETALNKKIREKRKPKTFITIYKANARNLKNIDVSIGINVLNVIVGVSGSGKTTLSEVLFHSFESFKKNKTFLNCDKIVGLENFSDVLFIDQNPIMKAPRSNIASYTKIFDEIRNIFSKTKDAIENNIQKKYFSFNVDGGRCPECKGMGAIKEDMQFLEDIYIPCRVCLGKRFKEKILNIEYKGKNISDVLDMSLDTAKDFFDDNLKIHNTVAMLNKLGLSHLRLGQSLSELSGGEAQRLKLVPYLTQETGENVLFIFDEPTTGLYPTDINKLILLFDSLLKNGHTILLVEHNEQIIKSSDYIIKLGEEGGEKGGYLINQGTLTDDKEKLFSFKELNDAIRHENPPILKDEIIIKNAYEHNLKNINLTIPLKKMISLVGVSGSGKSTIAKNIIFSEGQRNFIDCLSPYARFFIKGLKKPCVDSIDNIPPVIFLGQQIHLPSSLSTIGTVSECYNFLRLLFSKIGEQYCPKHPKQKIGAFSINDFIKEIKKYKNERIKILAPIIHEKKGTHQSIIEKAINLELSLIRVDGIFASPSKFLNELERFKSHNIDFVMGEFVPQNLQDDILTELIESTLKLTDNTLIIIDSKSNEKIFNKKMTCPICGYSSLKLDPEDFSFNSKRGVCNICKGTGTDKNGNICPQCNGSRLLKKRLLVKINDKNIFDLSKLTADELFTTLQNMIFESDKKDIADIILKELFSKLSLLIEIGLGDISLNRNALDISRGEYQRLRLSQVLGASLTNILYIFDEPSIGLCKEDNKKILSIFDKLKSQENTLLIIEHDKDTILHADHIIEIGPEGGKNGGEIVENTDIKSFLKRSKSITHKYLTQKLPLHIEKEYLKNQEKKYIYVNTGKLHNIDNVKCKFLFNSINCVIGISGAGKSTLVNDIISSTLLNGKIKIQNEKEITYSFLDNKIILEKKIERVLIVDQKPIAKNVRSTPASFLGIFDEIRKLLANTIDAKIRGYNSSYFSYNAGNGKCHYCKGTGVEKLEMSFMPDATIDCPVCQGKRFKDETLDVKYLGLNVYEILNLTFDEVKDIFKNHKKIYEMCYFANKIGIGYLRLGQVSGTLSGGEAQRLKLVKELAKPNRGHTLFILDEPSIGLHPFDVEKLNDCFNSLINFDNTILLIEHDEDIINNADYIVKMGPKSGKDGGKIISEFLNI